MFSVSEVYTRSELPLPELPQLKTRRLWDMVFTHSLPSGNQVISALGRRIFSVCVTEWLIDVDPGLNNTELMTRHGARVDDSLLAAFADEHALTPRLQYAKSAHKSSRLSIETKATLFAAYVGAVHRDHGYGVVRDWIFALMDWDNDTMLQSSLRSGHDVRVGEGEVKKWEDSRDHVHVERFVDTSTQDRPTNNDVSDPELFRQEESKSQRVLLYEDDVSALRILGSVLVATLEVNSLDPAELFQGNLKPQGNNWAQFDLVDAVVHANMMVETITSVKRGLHQYDDLSRREKYPGIIPPCDLPYFPSMMRNIENDVALRRKAINLRGQHALLFMDLLMEVLDKHPDAVGHGDLLKLLQRVVEASNQLPSQLLISGVTNMTYENEGGEATIFKCRYGDRDVAARVIHVKSRGEDEDLASSLQEIRREIITHRQLKNRNILELLGVFQTDQHPLAIITPWMENGETRKYLKAHPENFMTVVRGLCAAIRYLHCREPPIVHGDIKPSNVLIDESGEAVLSDFGFTRIRHELTRTGTRSTGVGTFRYLAPEVLSGEVLRANMATDIYSSALTIWELATSEPPFADLKEFLVLARVLKGERPPMPAWIGTFHNQSRAGKATWRLLVQMWSQDPDNRPPMKLVKEKIDLIQQHG